MDTSLVMDIAVDSLRVTVLVWSARWYSASSYLYSRNDFELYSEISCHGVGNTYLWRMANCCPSRLF